MLSAVGIVLLIGVFGAAFLMERGRRKLAALLASLVLGPVLYFCVGIAVPRVTGMGHFYSFPVGALRVGDADILWSLVAWVAACWALLVGLATLAIRARR